MKLFEITNTIWDLDKIEQEFDSAETSLNQIPGTFKKVNWEPNTINLDIGGGKEFLDDAGNSIHKFTTALKSRNVTNVVYDPFNRTYEHNRQVAKQIKDGGADTVTVNNVLNVIKEKSQRAKVIKQAQNALKENGTAYFLIYEGDKSGEGKDTSKGKWQNNQKAQEYVPEISRFFSDVTRKGNLIIAKH